MSFEPAPSEAGLARLLAVVKRTRNSGNLIRAIREGHVFYAGVDSHIFADGWKLWDGPQPDLSCISDTAQHKVWELTLENKGNSDEKLLAKPVEDLGDSMAGIPRVESISSAADMVFSDYVDFTPVSFYHELGNRKRSDRIMIANHPLYGQEQVIVKIAPIPDRLPVKVNEGQSDTTESELANEIIFHRELSPLGIVPKFLGFVTEKGRGTIGYFMEFLKNAKSFEQLRKEGLRKGGKPLSEEVIRTCLDVIQKMHDCRIYHGDLHSGNMMLCEDGSVKLIDLQFAKRLNDRGIVDGQPIYSAKEEIKAIERRLRHIGHRRPRMLTDDENEGDML